MIGKDGDEEIYAPYDETFLIMPTKRLFAGKTAVRLAYKLVLVIAMKNSNQSYINKCIKELEEITDDKIPFQG